MKNWVFGAKVPVLSWGEPGTLGKAPSFWDLAPGLSLLKLVVFKPGWELPSRGQVRGSGEQDRTVGPPPPLRPEQLSAYLLDVLGFSVRFHVNKGFLGRTEIEKHCPKLCLLSQGKDCFLLLGPISVCRSQAGQTLQGREGRDHPSREEQVLENDC